MQCAATRRQPASSQLSPSQSLASNTHTSTKTLPPSIATQLLAQYFEWQSTSISFSLSLVHSPIPFSHSLSPLSPFSQLWCQLCAPVTSSSACHGRLWAFSLVHILTLTLALDTLLLSLQEQAAATAALYGSLPYILTHYLTNLAGECCTGKSPLLRTN